MEPVLLPHELDSAVWRKIKAQLLLDLAERREYNDGESLTEKETASVRGQIKNIKRLLKFGEPKPDKQAGK